MYPGVNARPRLPQLVVGMGLGAGRGRVGRQTWIRDSCCSLGVQWFATKSWPYHTLPSTREPVCCSEWAGTKH